MILRSLFLHSPNLSECLALFQILFLCIHKRELPPLDWKQTPRNLDGYCVLYVANDCGKFGIRINQCETFWEAEIQAEPICAFFLRLAIIASLTTFPQKKMLLTILYLAGGTISGERYLAGTKLILLRDVARCYLCQYANFWSCFSYPCRIVSMFHANMSTHFTFLASHWSLLVVVVVFRFYL